jgi:hypothetical protein
MVDFLMISTRSTKRGVIEIYPKFIIKKSSDLMIRGGDFYAIWLEDRGLWSTDEQDALQLIDHELDSYAETNRDKFEANVKVLHMWDSESGMIDSWHRYCQKHMRDSFHMLDEKLIFSNMPTNKKDYASKRLTYPLEEGSIDAWDKLVSTLYSEEERAKIEWAIGSIVCGESKRLQKFMVLYGAAGTGKSTILNVIQKLFDGYYSVFDAKALGSSNNSFALEAFKTNPLVAIQHDGDLSKIEDNTRLNSLVSHELMTVNEKFKSTYSNRFKCFLFMGTNKPVKITDAKSGLIRRLIDVSPSGNKLSPKDYKATVKQVDFELGAIAYHCQEVYLANPGKYDDYIPVTMLGASNDFYNFVVDRYYIFKNENGTTLKAAWEMYKTYCDYAKVSYPFSQRIFKEELKNYFQDYKERYTLDDGTRVRSYYSGFKTDKFEEPQCIEVEDTEHRTIEFLKQKSIFDDVCTDCPAQYASSKETPIAKWDNVSTKLCDISTSKLHYVKVPENHIVIDFDITDKDGNKSFDLNLKEASKWPPTYAELSKSGKGIHLHYIYTGDVSKLSRVYDEHIEVKVFTGKSSLRRKLAKCNDIPIATISSGLPLKGEKNVIDFEGVKNEKALRTIIMRNLNKEYHGATKPSVDFIYKTLEDAYTNGMKYDVSDMYNAVWSFASHSTNHADYCIKLVDKMHFKSDEPSSGTSNPNSSLAFYDIEVFPNLLLVNWKLAEDYSPSDFNSWEDYIRELQTNHKPVVRMINPKPHEIEELGKFNLIGYNCRRYDNHIMYARLLGCDNKELYLASHSIIDGKKDYFYGEAYNFSYTDAFDFAAKKQSLKKWEIELGFHHQELGMRWDQPVPEDQWVKVAEYCDNDVLATEAVFNHLKPDFTARCILADVAGMTVNDTTNSLTTRIIFGNNKKPQSQFNYRFMGDESQIYDPYSDIPFYVTGSDKYTAFDRQRRPIFPGYKFEKGKSTYRGEEVGEGGYVYAEPGMYSNIALLDIASMHPSSIVAEKLFGEEYTARFNDILQARIAIKHKDFDKAKTMLGGALAKYLTDENAAAELAQALKIAINSVYGLTSAKFDNPFKDKRNVDNIVAKRGALFMVNLKHEVQKQGFTVAHIKTDSIKIPDATPDIIKFVIDYGKMYGYNFEHEATYDRMCLVNDAVYIARYATVEKCIALYGKDYVESAKDICKDNKKHPYDWTATGTQFQVPYVFKTLFSKENIEFNDMCETKSVTSALYLDTNEDLPDVSEYEKKYAKLLKEIGDISKLSDPMTEDCKEFEKLDKIIADGHDYHFIGKVGQFCPIKPGCGGGILLRETDKGYAAATGTKGYRWLESEMVRTLNKQDDIDKSYYNRLVDDAVKTISTYGDFERFAADEPYISDNTPPWFGAGEPFGEDQTPFDKR